MEVLGVSPHSGMYVQRQFQEPRKKKILSPSGERPLLSFEIFWFHFKGSCHASRKTDLGNIVSNN